MNSRACVIGVSILFIQAACALHAADGTTAAQPPRMAGNERELWLLDRTAGQTRAFPGLVTEPTGSPEPLSAFAEVALAVDGAVAVFTASGEFYSFRDGEWRRESDLPGRTAPLAAVANNARIVALVPLAVTREPQAVSDTATPREPRRDEFGAGGHAIVSYDGREWSVVAAVPPRFHLPAATGGLSPARLAIWNGRIAVVWRSGAGLLNHTSVDAATGLWSPIENIDIDESAVAFWPISLGDRIPAIAVSLRNPEGGEQLQVLRYLPSTPGHRLWMPTFPTISPSPEPKSKPAIVDVHPFSQQLTLMSRRDDGRLILHFARVDGTPTQRGFEVDSFLARQTRPDTVASVVQAVTMLIMLCVLACLFLLRRNALIAPPVLLPGFAPAFSMQRLMAGFVDFIPISLIVAAFLDVNWQAGFQQLLAWSFQTSKVLRIPDAAVITWWGASIGVYILYQFIAEWTAGRSVGKRLMGIRVVDETGASPAVWRIAVRNLTRAIELLPPFWFLFFLIVLSRKRQRLGDIFAGVLIIRQITAEEERDEAQSPQ